VVDDDGRCLRLARAIGRKCKPAHGALFFGLVDLAPVSYPSFVYIRPSLYTRRRKYSKAFIAALAVWPRIASSAPAALPFSIAAVTASCSREDERIRLSIWKKTRERNGARRWRRASVAASSVRLRAPL